MKNLRALHRYDRLMSNFQVHLQHIIQRDEPEDIHQFRVTIKRIRALLMLLEKASQYQFKKLDTINFITPLFVVSGRIREAQINYQLVQSFPKLSVEPFTTFLNQEEDRHKESLINDIKVFPIRSLEILNNEMSGKVQHLIDKDLDNIAMLQILGYFKKISIIKEESNKLHKIRKYLKACDEILKLTDEMKALLKMEGLKKIISSLNIIIGDWHDYRVLLDTINLFIHQYKTTIDHQAFETLVSLIQKQEVELKYEAFNILNDRFDIKELAIVEEAVLSR